jgi:hypothetical protein
LTSYRSGSRIALAAISGALAGGVSLAAFPSVAHASGVLSPGNLLVSTSQWVPADAPAITAGTTQLPPNCGGTTYAKAVCVTANANGSYPQVFNNDAVDGSFGITMPITLEELNPTTGTPIGTVAVPDNTASGDYLSTSFSSKSELSLNQSTDGQYVTFMGYVAGPGAVDVSNSDTPGAPDLTNTDSAASTYRAIGQLDGNGNFTFTETNAYSGNNGRAAVEDPQTGAVYLAGNAGNGSKPEPQGVVTGTGSQIVAPSTASEAAQSASSGSGVDPLDPYGNFNAYSQVGATTDKTAAKDNNYRGLAVYNNVVYLTKGSGSNGVNTVYYVDTAGGTCPSGSGVPSSSASLPSVANWTPSNATYGSQVPRYSTSDAALNLMTSNPGLAPTNACILKGFPTALASGATDASDYPFGIWFANPTTVYVADEGAGDNTYSSTANSYTAASASTTAGLQKWSFNGTTWVLDYTLQSGLNLGQPYSVPSNPADASDPNGGVYPTGNNTIAQCPTPTSTTKVDCSWTPATDGLRNLAGQVNADGTVTLWASTSTVSGSGDQGVDPNKLVSITDTLADMTAPQATGESFTTVIGPEYGQVVRGVSFTPGTAPAPQTPEVPWALVLPIAAAVVGGGYVYLRRRRTDPVVA